MKDFNTLERGIVLVTSAFTLGSALAISSNTSSTQAAELTITGKATISNVTETALTNEVISFTGSFKTKSSSGLFQGLVASSIANINLRFLHKSFTIGSETKSYIARVPDVPFISFTDGSKFEIANPFEVTKYSANDNPQIFSVFEGKYINDVGEFFQVGLFRINYIKNTSSEDNFSLTLANICCSPTPIPEPRSTGAVTVIGLLALGFSTKIISNRKNLS
ncbi:hypothetical protein [Anabaena azotica]|uniref:PEP-CTERM sorting domain-containing protein n=1 Tax=Anabaena azotica FACHB-119 TaxID=947527 RepID=A0ABR8D4V0_9NOST|nr:hypothetical protein [Anabaena azotica]MBD2501976.1 hypothetical protein [Anabaena azotica FACHB-119]